MGETRSEPEERFGKRAPEERSNSLVMMVMMKAFAIPDLLKKVVP